MKGTQVTFIGFLFLVGLAIVVAAAGGGACCVWCFALLARKSCGAHTAAQGRVDAMRGVCVVGTFLTLLVAVFSARCFLARPLV